MPLVRPARRDDLSRVMEIARLSGTAAQWSPEQYENYLTDAPAQLSVFLVITSENQIQGFAVGRTASHEADAEWELENIAVDPGLRCTGLGSHLLREFMNVVRGRATAVFLEVRESNRAARKLYEKLDFHEVGRRKAYYPDPPEDAVLLKHSF